MLFLKHKLNVFIPSLLFFLFCSINLLAQNPVQETNKNPAYFLNGKEIKDADLAKIEPKDIGSITVIKDASYGKDYQNGVIMIETKVYCIQRYQTYFSSKSADYKKILEKSKTDETLRYILNDTLLTKDFEGNLATIADSTFTSLNVIGAKELKKYGVNDSKYGVLIKANVKVPKEKREIQKSDSEPVIMIR